MILDAIAAFLFSILKRSLNLTDFLSTLSKYFRFLANNKAPNLVMAYPLVFLITDVTHSRSHAGAWEREKNHHF